jgi:hypothetical protein
MHEHRNCIVRSLLLMLVAGCAHVGPKASDTTPTVKPVQAPAESPTAANPQSPSTSAPVAPASEIPPAPPSAPVPTAPKSPSAAANNVPVAPVPKAGAASAGTAKPKAPAATATNTPAAQQPAPAVVVATPAKPAAAPTLDLAALEQRLRDTRAIGVFTKLSLKNQVDDLLDGFRAFHQGAAQPPLSQLRQKYELLFLKVLTVVQDGDPPLASAIASSREAIWKILTDPKKFAQI